MLTRGQHALINACQFCVNTDVINYKGETQIFNRKTLASKPNSLNLSVSSATLESFNCETGTNISDSYYTLQVGSGNTPANVQDVHLANKIADDVLKPDPMLRNKTFDDNKYTLTAAVSRMFTNVSDQPVTINEIGLYFGPVLISREVFSQPIILQPQQTKSFQAILF